MFITTMKEMGIVQLENSEKEKEKTHFVIIYPSYAFLPLDVQTAILVKFARVMIYVCNKFFQKNFIRMLEKVFRFSVLEFTDNFPQ